MVPVLISSDEIKKNIKGYHPEKASQFHKKSAQLADKKFQKTIKDIDTIYLMCGGSASGKTEFLSEYLDDFEGIIFDGTLSTLEGAKIKIKKIQRAKKKPIICAVFPDDLKRAFDAFLHRDRKFDDEHFYRTHSGSRKTLLWIAQNYLDVEIRIYESSYSKDKYKRKSDIIFDQLIFKSRKQCIEFLKDFQYTEGQILKLVHP